MQKYAQTALDHIRHLSETIGGPDSCTPEAHLAAGYIHAELEKLGIKQVG